MEIFLEEIDRIFQNDSIKRFYTGSLTCLTIFLLILIPFFIKRTVIIGSPGFDLCVRVLITYSYYHMFHFASHLDRYYENFYKGANSTTNSQPDMVKKMVNILASFFAGCCGGVFYYFLLNFFIPDIGILSFIVSIMIGLLLLTPFLSQYQKR